MECWNGRNTVEAAFPKTTAQGRKRACLTYTFKFRGYTVPGTGTALNVFLRVSFRGRQSRVNATNVPPVHWGVMRDRTSARHGYSGRRPRSCAASQPTPCHPAHIRGPLAMRAVAHCPLAKRGLCSSSTCRHSSRGWAGVLARLCGFLSRSKRGRAGRVTPSLARHGILRRAEFTVYACKTAATGGLGGRLASGCHQTQGYI